jgi:geranylgeranyl pyrophosphate synthase
MSEGSYETISRGKLLEAVEAVGAVEQACARGHEFAEAARQALDKLPTSEFCQTLKTIPTYVLDRDR